MKKIYIAIVALATGAYVYAAKAPSTPALVTSPGGVSVYTNQSTASTVLWTVPFKSAIFIRSNMVGWYKVAATNGGHTNLWIQNGSPMSRVLTNVVTTSFVTNNTATKFTNRTRYTNLTTVVVTNIFTNGVLSNSRSVTNIAITSNITLKTGYVISYTTNRTTTATNFRTVVPAYGYLQPKTNLTRIYRFTNGVELISRTNLKFTAPNQLSAVGRTNRIYQWFPVTNRSTHKIGNAFIDVIKN